MFRFGILFCHGKFIKIGGEEGARLNFTAPTNTKYCDPFLTCPFWEIFHRKTRRIFFPKFS